MTSGWSTVTHLCFHGIGTPGPAVPESEARYWVSEDMFRRVLDLVTAHSDVRLSFDDGNVSDVEIGLPELVARGLSATFFVLAGRLGETGSLGPEHLAALRSAGMTIGSHGMAHRPWRGLSVADQAVEFDLARSAIAEAAGAPVHDAACPLGSYDRQVLSALRRRGYQRVHTSDRAVARVGAHVQPRFSLRSSDDVDVVLGYLRHRYRWPRRAQDQLRMFVKSAR